MKSIGGGNIPTQQTSIKNISVIINPNAGIKNKDAQSVIEEAMKTAGIASEMSLTQKAGDGFRFAQEAVKKSVDAVAVYGGDGTIMEVSSGLLGSDVPLLILPGGSANVLANELGISKDLKDACALLSQAYEIKTIDAGRLNDRYFIVRTSLGFEAEMVKGADRETKKKIGVLAYVLSAIYALAKIRLAVYRITIDGKEFQTKGLTCIVTNTGNLGFTKISMDKAIDISDGLLDVLVVRKVNFRLIKHILATLVRRERPHDWDLVAHWQGKDVQVLSNPMQRVECDGEILGKVPFHARILPSAIKVLVPLSL